MNLSHASNRTLGMRPALSSGDQQALGQGLEIKSAVEAIGKSAKILLGVLAKTKAVVTATQAGLEVTQHRVDPLQLRHLLGLSSGHNGAFMGATCFRHSVETGQPIGVNGAAGGQVLTGPLRDDFGLEARHRVELDAQRVAFIADRDGSDKSHLVLRATPDLPSSALAAQISVFHLDFATEHVAGFTLCHGLHQLVMHQPGCGIAHAQLAFECECRQTGFGLTDEVDRQKPCRQRQLGRLKNGARDQRGLMPTGIALENLVPIGMQEAVCGTTATRTAKTIGPASSLQRRRAKRLGAKELEKFRHRQAVLELDAIHGHDAAPKDDRWLQVTPSKAHQVSLAEDCC